MEREIQEHMITKKRLFAVWAITTLVLVVIARILSFITVTEKWALWSFAILLIFGLPVGYFLAEHMPKSKILRCDQTAAHGWPPYSQIPGRH
jgi:hypothetical protein